MTSLRRFRPDDLSRISKCNLDPLTETYDLSFYLMYYAKWPNMFQVAEDARGNIVGYVMGKTEESPIWFKETEHYLPWHGHITALTVAPEARRTGIGRILTAQLEAAAEKADALFIDLFVRRSNTRAINFYKKMGYSVYRVVKGYYADNVSDPRQGSEDAFDMRKACSADKEKKHIREDGEQYEVQPEDVF